MLPALLAVGVTYGPDELIFLALNVAGSNVALDVLMVGISALALAYVLPLVALPLWSSGRRDLAVDALVLLAVTIVATEAFKVAIAKPRPCEFSGLAVVIAPEFCPGTLDAFPSGHASRAFAVATLLATRTRPLAGGTSFVLAGLVGVSRIYLGVHWPSDVLGGAALGVALGIAWWALSRQSARYRTSRDRVIAAIRGLRRPSARP